MKKTFFFFTFLCAAIFSQAQIKISAMPTASGNPAAVFVPVLEGGINKKILGAKFMYDSAIMATKYGNDTMRNNLYAAIGAVSGGSLSLTAIGASPNVNGLTYSSGVLNLQPASASFGGVITTGSQTFSGVKTFNNDLVVNAITAGRGPGNISNNTVLGNFIVSATNVGAANTIIGNSGFFINNTTGGGNTVVGFNTSVSNTTGNGNTVMGSNAASFISTGSNNTIIGSGTGGLQLSTGSNNTLIGNLNTTGNSLGNPSNNIILSDGAGNFRLRFDNTGRGTLTGNDLRYAANYAANYTSRSLTDLNALDSITSKKIKDSATKIITLKGVDASFSVTGDTLNLKDYCKTVTAASGATITPNSDTTNMYAVTALAVNTTFAAPLGTPEDGRSLLIRIKDDGTSRTLTFNSIYRASTDFALPALTTISKTMYVQFIYNSADSKWDAVGLTNGF